MRQVLQNAPERTLVHAESSKKRRYVFLEHLVERTRDPDVLRDQLMSGMLGGRDTTSSLLGNLFYTLARRPDIWKKLKAEIGQIETQPPTMGDISAAKYARNCLQECENLTSTLSDKSIPSESHFDIADSTAPPPSRSNQSALGQQRRDPTLWW